MALRQFVVRVVEIAVVVALVSMIAGALVGQPVLLSYAETGSMEPAIGAGDGFVAVPSVVTGPPSDGDIVVYQAEQLQGGGLTTHRVVGETQNGYITKGDANPFTDQDAGEPPVSEDRTVAHALQVGGRPIVIPYLGIAIAGVQDAMIGLQNAIAATLGIEAFLEPQGVGLVLLGVGFGLFGLSLLLGRIEGPTRDQKRRRSRTGGIDARRALALLLVVVLLPANVAMVVPSGVHTMTVDGDTVAQNADVDQGDPASWEYTIDNRGLVPKVVVFDTTDPTVSVAQYRRVLMPGETRELSIAVTAPPPGFSRTGTVREHHYLLVLPPSVIETLHETSPLVAWLATNGLLVVAVVALLANTVGFGRVRVNRGSDLSLWVTIRRRYL